MSESEDTTSSRDARGEVRGVGIAPSRVRLVDVESAAREKPAASSRAKVLAARLEDLSTNDIQVKPTLQDVEYSVEKQTAAIQAIQELVKQSSASMKGTVVVGGTSDGFEGMIVPEGNRRLSDRAVGALRRSGLVHLELTAQGIVKFWL